MKYYCIAEASDETIGAFPQAHIAGDRKGSEVSHIVEMMSKSRFPSLPDDLELKFNLDRRAIETDFLSAALYYGLLVSPKLWEILQQHNLPPHQIIKALVNIKGQEKTCHWIQFTEDLVTLVDFRKTKFAEYEPWTQTRKELMFQNDDERAGYVKTVKTLTTVTSKDLHLLQTEFDLLKIRYIFQGFLVSDKLLPVLRAQGITGFTSIDYVSAVSP